MFVCANIRVYTLFMFTELRFEHRSGSRVAMPEAHPVGRSDDPAETGDGEPDWVELNREAATIRAAARGAERGPFLEAQSATRLGLESLTDSDLLDRVVRLTAERSRIEAEYLAAVGELVSRDGAQSAAWQLREYTRMNGAQARSEARLAESLAEHSLGDTLDALAAGEIQMSHARVIAREAPKTHRRSESDFLGLCRDYPSDVVARHSLAYESEQVYADLAAEAAAATPGGTVEPADAELALQRHQRRCSMRLGDDGMWHLNADLDYLVGRQISMQLAAAERAVRQRDDSAEDTFPQRNADALCDLILGRQRPGASLVIAADYDSVSGQLANPRLDDGTPISANQLAELAADAKILPAIFNSDWSQLALGRVRSASDAQRIILAIRDGGCIACATHSEHCHAHHIGYFEDGGHTDIPNLANLCEPCHLDHHQRHWPIETPPNGRPRRAPPSGQPSPQATTEPSGRDPTAPSSQQPVQRTPTEPSGRDPTASPSRGHVRLPDPAITTDPDPAAAT